MDNIKEVNAFGEQGKKTKFVLGTYYYSDPWEEPYTQDLGMIVNLSESEDLMLDEMKKIAKPILENLKNVEIKNVEDLRFQQMLSSDIDLSEEEEVKSFRFQYKENGEWEFDFGLFIREYIRYENDSKEFKELVDKGVLEVI